MASGTPLKSFFDPLCPDKDPKTPHWNISSLQNRTIFLSESIELPAYLCFYYFVIEGINDLTFACAIFKITGCFLGIISSLAAVYVFTRPNFLSVSFLYHRVINTADILTAFMYLQDGLSYLIDYKSIPAWLFLRIFILIPVSEFNQYWINLVTVWVAIERCIATLYPKYFKLVNKTVVAYTVMGITLAVTVGVWMPHMCESTYAFDEKKKAYVTQDSAFAKSDGYIIYAHILSGFEATTACVMVAATVGVIIGLVKTARRKKKLRASIKGVGYNNGRILYSAKDKEALRQCSLNIQLCILQLCESVPLITHEIFNAVHDRIEPFTSSSTLMALPTKKTYEKAVDDAYAFLLTRYFWLLTRVASFFAHNCHFYWYIIFCPRVRKYVMSVVSRKKNIRVSSATNRGNDRNSVTRLG